jgi:hypothetical protein
MNRTLNKRIFPFVWPWQGKGGETLSLRQFITTKSFTILYLIIIWSLIGVLGFASTWDCRSTWQLALQCDYAFWIRNLSTEPLMFTRNLFTTPFIHNGLDHILFVSVLGFLLMVQSYETHFGTRKTIIMFFLAYLIVAPFFAALYSLAINFYPGSEFLNYVMSRNWVGGSIGMFQLYGALATLSRRPLIMLAAPVVFETFNLLVIEIHPQISIMHLTCTFVGYGLSSGINTK